MMITPKCILKFFNRKTSPQLGVKHKDPPDENEDKNVKKQDKKKYDAKCHAEEKNKGVKLKWDSKWQKDLLDLKRAVISQRSKFLIYNEDKTKAWCKCEYAYRLTFPQESV